MRVTSKLNELRPSVTFSYMAWDENRPPGNRVNVMAQTTGGQSFKVNAQGTSAFMGALDGSRLIYEEDSKRRDSDLVLVDLASGARTPMPTGVNTPKEEREPSMDGDWVAFLRAKFGRIVRASLWLVQLSTGELRRLDSAEHDEFPLIGTGHVNGNFVTWFRCVGRPRTPCHVSRYDITTGTTVRVPNPDRLRDLAPAPASDGTVYFMRSGLGCGRNAFLMKWTGSGAPSVILDFPPGIDGATPFVYEETSPPELHYAKIDCRTDFETDLYKVVE